MRMLPSGAKFLGCAVALAIATPGIADAKDPADVDISKYKDKLVILHDGKDHYVGLVPTELWVLFYSRGGKVFYEQRVRGGGANESAGQMSRSFWAPNVRGNPELRLHNHTEWSVQCGEAVTPLQPVDDKTRAKILDKAAFKPALWQRQAYALARDEEGRYYYVDRLRTEAGLRGFRLFRGHKGKLKKQKMIDVVHDSEGDIFATPNGNLRLILDRTQSAWLARDRSRKIERTELTSVPVGDNVYLIYAELGVYNERLGTPCDDL